MANPKKSANVRIKLFSKEGIRCAFPHFFQPWANEGDDEDKAKYQALICLDKDYDKSLIKKVNDGVKEVVTEFWGKAATKKIGKSIDTPLTDGEDKGKYEVLENYFTLSAKKSGKNKNGKELPPPKMMALVGSQYMTPDHKDWDDDMMMTGRYCFVIDLYTSVNANSRGDKVCVGLVSVLALPALEGDEDEVMPGFGAVESAVEDDFAELLDEMGVEAAIPSTAGEFEDDDEPEEPEDDDDEDLDAELDSEEDESDDEDDEDLDDEDEEVEEPEPAPKKRGRGRPKATATKTTPTKRAARSRKATSKTGETKVADADSDAPKKTKRTRAARTHTRA